MFTGSRPLTSLLRTIIDSIYFVDETCKCSDLILCNVMMECRNYNNLYSRPNKVPMVFIAHGLEY